MSYLFLVPACRISQTPQAEFKAQRTSAREVAVWLLTNAVRPRCMRSKKPTLERSEPDPPNFKIEEIPNPESNPNPPKATPDGHAPEGCRAGGGLNAAGMPWTPNPVLAMETTEKMSRSRCGSAAEAGEATTRTRPPL